MDTNCEYFSYEGMGYFSKLMVDYVSSDEKLGSFYRYPVSIEGIKASIENRKRFNTNRELLVEELRSQYSSYKLTPKQEQNLQLLLHDNTYTTCTAHQPNIFTGPLYFIYKIIHAIKLADHLKTELPESNFVPVYYMGSEDADLDELGHIFLNGEKLEWETKQTGAVGRMLVDKQLTKLIERMSGQLTIFESGKHLINLFKESYKEGRNIQEATLQLVNELFKDFGLLIVIPDNANLKRSFNSIVKKELLEQFSHPLVEETNKQIGENYKVQAGGRDLNLFYLTETKRERIEKNGVGFKVGESELVFNQEEILNELDGNPERFSANVILRGVFQETILPNIAFIGGGGEIAYWLELQKVFEAAEVPYPMLIVRNSLLLLTEEQEKAIQKLGFHVTDMFKPTSELVNRLVKRETKLQLSLNEERTQLEKLYDQLQEVTYKIDVTLTEHTSALKVQALKKIDELEKKMLRAEKRKFEAQQRQINRLRQQLFPKNSLQERVENFSIFYAKYGKELLKSIYDNSLSLEQEFCVLKIIE